MPKQKQTEEPTKYATVCWVAADIKNERPRWSLAKCEEFLEGIEKNLEERMIERGSDVIEYELAGVK